MLNRAPDGRRDVCRGWDVCGLVTLMHGGVCRSEVTKCKRMCADTQRVHWQLHAVFMSWRQHASGLQHARERAQQLAANLQREARRGPLRAWHEVCSVLRRARHHADDLAQRRQLKACVLVFAQWRALQQHAKRHRRNVGRLIIASHAMRMQQQVCWSINLWPLSLLCSLL
jgi:hypothetical protein